MTYGIKVEIPRYKKNWKETKTRVAMAELFASSPYLSKEQKDTRIKKLFK